MCFLFFSTISRIACIKSFPEHSVSDGKCNRIPVSAKLIFLFCCYIMFPLNNFVCVCVCMCVCVWWMLRRKLACFWYKLQMYRRNVLKHFFLIYSFWLCCMACGILVPRSGIKLTPPEVEAQILNHWTTREVSGEMSLKHSVLNKTRFILYIYF